jgi:hypothetical protein
MPQVSSIARGAATGTDGDGADTTAGVPDRDHAVARLRDSPDVFSIFSLTASFDIPMCDLPPVKGVSSDDDGPMRRSYGLGTGVSCTVSVHQTGEAERGICGPGMLCDDMIDDGSGTWLIFIHAGKLVALKWYSTTPDDLPGGGRANRKLCQLLWQELSVFTHLRSHENICNLLFVGWDRNSTVPSLALELAQYGKAMFPSRNVQGVS